MSDIRELRFENGLNIWQIDGKMADKHSLNYDVRELKLGTSFTNNRTSQYHTIKYDFKPASVDVNKMATVDVGTNNQVTVTVPHLDGAGVPQTVFKGSQRPYTKECVLIIDRDTGEITLEKLSSNIQVKKTRQENSQKPRPLTPLTAEFTNTTQRSTSRTRVATNRRSNNTGNSMVNTPATGAPQATNQNRFANSQKPQNMVRSPPRIKTSPPEAPWSAGGNSTLASLPMIGFEDAQASAPPPASHVSSHAPHVPQHVPHAPHVPNMPLAHHAPHGPQHVPHVPPPGPHVSPSLPPSLSQAPSAQRHVPPPSQAPRRDDSSSSSSSDSDSGSGSDSDSDDNDSGARPPAADGGVAGALPADVLNDDLCLSESGSDFD